MQSPHPYPVDALLPRLCSTLLETKSVVLSSPPGSGKTTRIPPALLAQPWLYGKKILMLEPRRLAARGAAEFIASSLAEKAGGTVGYSVRGDTRVSDMTRILIVTEGILTRMILHEQDLPGVGLVIFDEFHERSIHADMGLALTIDLQRHLRPDLRILVMSATLDTEAVSGLLGNAPTLTGSGTMFPVSVSYTPATGHEPIDVRMAETIRRAIRDHEGDVLAFLPGVREISRTEQQLTERGLPDDTVVHQLYGDASYDQQRSALMPAPRGKRKIILSTSIAETSLTIEGIAVVIDSGLTRRVRFDPRRGMAGLVTEPVSRATAEQRRGRAGRVREGFCYRLWGEADHDALPEYPVPEMRATDLAHVALELAVWGDPFGDELRFLDPPPRPHLEQARTLLADLGAINEGGVLTVHGKQLANLPIHPRYAHMIIRARELGHGSLSCDLAALLEERDLLAGRPGEDIDLTSRLLELNAKTKRTGSAVRERIREQAGRLRQLTGILQAKASPDAVGLLLGLAYPDRVAKRRGTGTRYLLASGRTAHLPSRSVLERHEYLAAGIVDGAGQDVRILLAAPMKGEDVETIFGDRISEEEEIRWDASAGAVIARSIRKAGSIVLSERLLSGDSPSVLAAMIDGVRSMGVDALPWTKETRSFVERSEWIRTHVPVASSWPDCSISALEATLDEWLAPYLGGVRKKEALATVPLLTAIRTKFSHAHLRKMDELAPGHLHVPSGSNVALSYASGEHPVLAVKLQELFGLTTTPTVAGGRIPVTIHLLSPAARPLAVTQDLPSFWKNVYPEIRSQMRSRYPRHPWPEDPMTARPTRRTTPRKRS